jgi:hypothetical protein
LCVSSPLRYSELGAHSQGSLAVTPAETSIEPKAPKDFVKIEKNLNTLGFFTPAKHRGAKSREKVVFFRRELNGKTIEAQATIRNLSLGDCRVQRRQRKRLSALAGDLFSCVRCLSGAYSYP